MNLKLEGVSVSGEEYGGGGGGEDIVGGRREYGGGFEIELNELTAVFPLYFRRT